LGQQAEYPLSPASALRTLIFWSVAVVSLFSWGLAICADLPDRFIDHRMRDIASQLHTTEVEVSHAAGADGLFLRFKNFPPELSDFPHHVYSRAAFTLYPQRVLAGDPSVPIATDEQLVGANFDPDPAWLIQHDIHALLQYQYDAATQKYSLTSQQLGHSPSR
jgi:hypothetical protein